MNAHSAVTAAPFASSVACLLEKARTDLPALAPESLPLLETALARLAPPQQETQEGIDAAATPGDAFAALADALTRGAEQDAAETAYQIAAAYDHLAPQLLNVWGGPFNGQAGRQALFQGILTHGAPDLIVETGTFRGSTTQYMAQSYDGPVITCEANRRFFEYSKKRFESIGNIQQVHSDSRPFLQSVIDPQTAAKTILFYLDAHWEQDLPLWEELDIIFSRCENAIVMVDDFRIPFDVGYTYDDYGPGKRLTVIDLRSHFSEPVQLLFPTLPSGKETGARRGTVIVARDAMARKLQTGVSGLRLMSVEEALILDASVGELTSQTSHIHREIAQILATATQQASSYSTQLLSAISQIHALQDQTNALREQVQSATQQVHALHDERKTLIAQIDAADEVRQQNVSLATQLDSALQQIHTLHEERAGLITQIATADDVRQQNVSLTTQLESALQQIHTLHDERSVLVARIESAEGQVGTAHKERVGLISTQSAEIETVGGEPLSLRTQLDSALQQIHTLHEERTALAARIESAERQVQTLHEERAAWVQRLGQAEEQAPPPGDA